MDFSIKFEGKPEKPITLSIYAFDEKGEAIAVAKVKENIASIALTDTKRKQQELYWLRPRLKA